MNEPTMRASLCLASQGRVYAKISAKIMEPKLDDIQCDFHRGRSITEQISTLHKIFEKCWEHAKDVCT